jgi:hypothetical protein
MAIRFALADDQEAALAFGYSPLLETVLSLHVLVGPKHHALQHEWVRAMRGLRPPLRREIAELSFLYRWTLPNCILPSATTGYEDFDDELARLRSLRVDVAAFELVRTLYDHGGTRPRSILADADVRSTVLKRAASFGTATRRAATLLFDDPREFVERFARLLEAYWEEAFAEEWQRREPTLAESVVTAGREIASDGVFAFLIGLAPTLRVDPDASTFGLDIPHDHEVALSSQNPLLLVPSIYVGRMCESTATRRGRCASSTARLISRRACATHRRRSSCVCFARSPTLRGCASSSRSQTGRAVRRSSHRSSG